MVRLVKVRIGSYTLNPHYSVGLKGHARPTHYTVVHDENKFTAVRSSLVFVTKSQLDTET